MKITFIGLGIMGSRMAANLFKAGVDLTIWNRTPEAMEPLLALGAKGKSDLKTALSDADVVISMLAHPEAVSDVFINQGGLAHLKPDAIWLDCSTVNPSFVRTMLKNAQDHGIKYHDAPVAGTLPHAENAQLTFFAGGSKEELTAVDTLLDAMGQKTLYMGEVGDGASFKMLVNLQLAQSMIAFSETVLLGEKLGFDESFLLNTIPSLVVSAPFTKAKSEMIKSRDYSVQFPLELMHKDLHLAALSAYEVGQPLRFGNIAKEIFAEAKKQGAGKQDFAAIHEHLR